MGDVDGNNVIAYSEFLAAALDSRLCLGEEVLRATFRRFDSDQSGVITVDNLRQILGDTFEGVSVEELIREADANDDGNVSYEEFASYVYRTSTANGQQKVNEEQGLKLLDKMMS